MAINKNKLGLTVGIFAAILHAVWAILVGAGIAQTYLNWIFPMHFIGNVFQVANFSLMAAVLLIILAFIGGYICGWILGVVWNWVDKGNKKR